MIQLDNISSSPSLKAILPNEPAEKLLADDGLCELYFSDERSHIIHRIEAFLKDIDLSIYSRDEIGKLVDEFQIASPFQLYLFLVDNTMTLFADGISDKIEYFDDLLEALKDGLSSHMEYSLGEYLGLMHLPYITKNVANKLTEGFKDINDFYDELNIAHNQVYLISDRLGLGRQEGIVIATQLYKILLEHEKELRECQELISIRDAEDTTIITLNPYISDNLNNYYCVADFIAEIVSRDNTFSRRLSVRQLHRLHPAIDIFITDDKEKDIKLIEGISGLNPDIKIMGSEEYLDYIADLCINN